jgi:hypothetical protein
MPRDDRQKLDFLTQMVLQPLHYLPGKPRVRVVLDGLDHLSHGTRRELRRILDGCPDHLRLVMTTRDNTPDCPDGEPLRTFRTDRAVLSRYLVDRGVPDTARAAILDRANVHWLVTRLLADAVLSDPGLDLAHLPGTVNEAYAVLLDQAGAADAWRTRFSPVLGVLAVAGTGPVLPVALLVHTSVALEGPSDDEAVHEVLAALCGLVARRDSGAPDEHAGLFHSTLVDYLLSLEAASAGFAIDAQGAHRALALAIDTLAPVSAHDVDDSLHRYAFLREADHWWALGDAGRALECLVKRVSNVPRENLDRWMRWQTRTSDQLGCDHPVTLATRNNVANWTGEAGDAREAVRLLRELLPDQERVLGRDHPGRLLTRNNLAHWTG